MCGRYHSKGGEHADLLLRSQQEGPSSKREGDPWQPGHSGRFGCVLFLDSVQTDSVLRERQTDLIVLEGNGCNELKLVTVRVKGCHPERKMGKGSEMGKVGSDLGCL